MNKTVFYLVFAVMPMFFTACNENAQISDSEGYLLINENPLIVKAINVENTSEDIYSANVITGYQSTDNEWHYLEFSAKYKNGGFELNFPETISDEYLQRWSETVLEGVQISDIQAKIRSVYVEAHNNVESNIGGFSFRSDNCGIGFMYSDRNFTMNGVSNYSGSNFDCSFKKGWNIVYYLNGGKKQTTQKPKNEIFKCYFSYNTIE